MKKLILSLAWLFAVSMSNAQIIPNAGFESWTNFGTYSDPTGWSRMNSQQVGFQTCEQGMPGASGNSFLLVRQ